MGNILIIKADQFHASILLDKLPELPLVNLRKLFSLMFQYGPDNDESIFQLTDYLKTAVPESKEAWARASIALQNGYRDPANVSLPAGPFKTKREARKAWNEAKKNARANNKMLLRNVKAAKRGHERWSKIGTLWEETKQKYDKEGFYYG